MNINSLHKIKEHHQQPYVLRMMTADDLQAVCLIEQATQAHPWTLSQFQSSLQSSHQCCVLTSTQTVNQASNKTSNKMIVAYAITSTAADEAELLNITVALDSQRQGLGQLLLEQICDSFDDTIHSLFLEVRASNQAAIALYDKLYFNEVGLRANYYPSKKGRREDAIIMAKPLSVDT
ncbi:MAG: ribosomal-protein-alanine N-acetyltransferase [Candidatus Endobugula sp.]|jgi:ribosomal-protein-alanine N-acetyltransferase